MKAYFISGLGASCNVFDKVQLPSEYTKEYLEWIQPLPEESIENYAQRMAKSIDSSQEFILIGLSFGGIIAQEIAHYIPPKKLILISTIKSQKEKPPLFTFSKYTHAHRLIPMQFFTSDRVISYAFFRKIYSRNLPVLKSVFVYRDPYYLRWSFSKIIHWNPKPNGTIPTYHLHGDKDPLFSIKRIENPLKISNGNHLMIITKTKKINQILQEILQS